MSSSTSFTSSRSINMAWFFIDTHALGQFRVGWLMPTQVHVRVVEGRAHGLLNEIETEMAGETPDGICVVAGPGRFSSIRTGVLQANLMARWHQIPLVGVAVDQTADLEVLAKDLEAGVFEPQGYIAPVYDAEPNITTPNP